MSKRSNKLTSVSSFLKLFNFSSLRSFRTWQELFIFFWLFSVAGHYIEVMWTMSPLSGTWRPIMESITPLAAPYGVGAVSLIIFVWPLVKHRKFNPIIIYVLCTIVASIVEYLSAVLVVIMRGKNYFWNYSNHPFNVNGYISLDSSLVLGILATLFIYFVYPICDMYVYKIKYRWINIAFWFMSISYIADLIHFYIK